MLTFIRDGNPQLVRELQTRLQPRSLLATLGASLLAQALLYFGGGAIAPKLAAALLGQSDRYCQSGRIGAATAASFHNPPGSHCLDAAGQYAANVELWWLDLFAGTSLLGVLALLGIGTYLLVEDIARERERGTLELLRLSPMSAAGFWYGKLLGVPVLLYGCLALALPLHLGAGLAAGISLEAIAGFYAVVLSSGALVYSLAALIGVTRRQESSFAAWLASTTVMCGVLAAGVLQAANVLALHDPFDWLLAFAPTRVLPYLVGMTPHSLETVGYFNVNDAGLMHWYGQSWWMSLSGAIAFCLLNNGVWTFWIWQGLRRQFADPSATLLSKPQSYWLSCSFVVCALGFAYPEPEATAAEIVRSFSLLFALETALVVATIAALSPRQQTLYDWARFRHLGRRPLADFVEGERSPAPVAIGLNLLMISLGFALGLVFFPLEGMRGTLGLSMLLLAGVLLLCACVAQWLLALGRSWAGALLVVVLPPLAALGLNVSPGQLAGAWSLSVVPLIPVQQAAASTIALAILGQWLAILGASWALQRRLRRVGQSATRSLLAETAVSEDLG